MIFAFLASLAFLIAGTVADIRLTNRGILKGLAVEGNDIITHFYGVKPTLHQLYLMWVLMSLPTVAPGVFGLVSDNIGLDILSIVCMATLAAHHLKGAWEWAKLGA